MSFKLKTFLASTGLALAFGPFAFSVAYAQTSAAPSGSHSKAAGIPEKKPDGTWEGLKPAQQKILMPLESDWDYMSPDSRKKWIQVAIIYPKMSEKDQERLQSRMSSWSSLSQKDRRLARDNYLSSLKFPAEKKAEAWSAYQKLSDEQKKKLADSEAKKKPTAASAPTLQQIPIKQKPSFTPISPVESAPPPASPEPSSTNN
ncbi:DUF3106 domain-containing protein [Polynucleobacter sp. AP-Melu-500A-A1]|jgi:hypothetical protein|uniref:DUF3106 domain-containing protein n=1 Tax=Polynucleobacter sp. AP-Melu-500A-A1 TaxID=2576929 RepID=UPI001C0E8777|nr:DUF3106 domain-containing protein [Polynucleobacter sp. AP-Melu-500A-A1]MBU3630129.1 DUF3106 domain-containing protein [Polynucleobacter sp. AP-Melu-500A-A1]